MATQQIPLYGLYADDVGGNYIPDLDCSYNYCFAAYGNDEASMWGTPTTGAWYTIKLYKQGSSGWIEIIDRASSTLLASMTFYTNNWTYIDRIAIGTWNQSYMNENITWDSGQQNVRVNIWRSGAATDGRIDNLKIYQL
jgi:hypothetical protein